MLAFAQTEKRQHTLQKTWLDFFYNLFRQVCITKQTRQVYNLFKEAVEQPPLGLKTAEKKPRLF